VLSMRRGRAPRAQRSFPFEPTQPSCRRTGTVSAYCGALALCLLLAVAGEAYAQVLRLEPIDDNATDLGWLDEKNRLLTAIEARDRRALLAAIDADIDNGPGQQRGLP